MERGFIQGKLQIKVLLLYILSRADAPMEKDTLADVAMCDDGVGYFDFADALAELVSTGHVSLEEGKYAVTERGRETGAVIEDELPYSVCMRCDRKLAEINERLREERRVKTELVQQEDGGWRVTLSLDGEEAPLFTLTLTLPLREDAQRLIRRFQADPRAFYQTLCAL